MLHCMRCGEIASAIDSDEAVDDASDVRQRAWTDRSTALRRKHLELGEGVLDEVEVRAVDSPAGRIEPKAQSVASR